MFMQLIFCLYSIENTLLNFSRTNCSYKWRDTMPLMRGKKQDGLVLYKRHKEDCEVHQTNLPEDGKRFYWECPCMIWITGRYPNSKAVIRMTTGTGILKRAQAARDAVLANHMSKETMTAERGPTITYCIEQHLQEQRHGMKEQTYVQTQQRLKNKLQVFLHARGVFYMREVTAELLGLFRTQGLPNLKDTTKKVVFENLRSFLRTASEYGWTTENLADKVKPHQAMTEQKQPYTDKEIERMMDEAECLHSNNGTRFARDPKTFRLLLELMLATGMRIGDALRYDPRTVARGESGLEVYTYVPQKQRITRRQKTAVAYLTPKLKQDIDDARWLTPERWPFYYGEVNDKKWHYLGCVVRLLMKAIGERANIADCRPHRLRDTFAVRSLLKGMSLEGVSRLLNHSGIAVTEQYYAPWITDRQRQLERTFAETVMDSPQNTKRNPKRGPRTA